MFPVLLCIVLMILAHNQAIELYFLLLCLLGLLNPLLGEYTEAELRRELHSFDHSRIANMAKLLAAVTFTGFNIWGLCFVFGQQPRAGEMVLLVLAAAHVNGCMGLSLAHELEHSRSRIQLLLGDLLLFWVCLPFFREDHIHGHHALVGTPADRTSARPGQTFYHFFIGAFRQRIGRSYFQSDALSKESHQQLIRFSGLIVVFALLLLYAMPLLLGYWMAQALVVYVLYELTNYIQHYGLDRQPGKPIEIGHSWNCHYKYSNCLMFLLPVHSPHHVGKPLHLIPKLLGPRMPLAMLPMMLVALLPPLWFWLMDPMVARYQQTSFDIPA